MNHRILPVAVFLTLMLTSLWAGHHNYCTTYHDITADLNQALLLTLEEEKNQIVTQDTIRTYKQLRQASGGPVLIAVSDERFCRHLKNPRLKEAAFLTFDIMDEHYRGSLADHHAICSDTLVIPNGQAGEVLALKGYARLSAASVFCMSDQRLPVSLMVAAILWAIGSVVYTRKNRQNDLACQLETGYGGLVYSETDNRFYSEDHTPIRFTPMQHQLMQLFWLAPSHSLSKEEICAALWPKKEDANDTLYTLIRRLKPIVEEHTRLKIVTERGRHYSLEIKEMKV